MTMLQFSILGRLELRVDGRAMPIPVGYPQALLSALLMSRGHLSVEQLTTALWDDAPASATANLRTYTGYLRRALGRYGDRLRRVGDGYRLHVESGELDLHSWESALAYAHSAARNDLLVEATEHLAVALALWTGKAAEGVPRRGPIGRSLELLDQARCSTIERYAEECLNTDRRDEAVDRLRQLLAEHPTREYAWHLLALAQSHSGDRSGALRTCAAAREALVAGLGLEPGTDLRRLQRALLTDAAGRRQPAPVEPVDPTACPTCGR